MARKRKPVTEPLLVCPYTGRQLELVYDDDTRHPGWFLRGGLDMGVPFLSKENMYVANTMRGGKKNIAQHLTCAYTGTRLTAVEIRGLWYARGDLFSLSVRRYKDELLYRCSFRNGTPPDFSPPTKVEAVGAEAEEHEHFVDTLDGLAHNASDDEADEMVDGLIK